MKQTAGRDALGTFAPKFAELNNDVLFGEVWSRESGLSHRDRSLLTITSLMTSGLVDSSFRYHLETAKKNGITRTEIAGGADAPGILQRLAESLGGLSHGEGSLDGGRGRGGKRRDLPGRQAQ